MIASGLIIPRAYIQYMNNRDFRPPFLSRIDYNIKILDDKRGVTSLDEFAGFLWVAYCTSSHENNDNVLIHKKVQALRAKFPDQQIKAAIFMVDATVEEAEKLSIYRQKHANFLTDEDYVIAANAEPLQKFLRNELQFEGIAYEKEGNWIYDPDLIIFDRLPSNKKGQWKVLAHIRGHFDYETAIMKDKEAMKQKQKVAPYEQKINDDLVRSFQYFIKNPNEKDKALMGEQKK